MTTWHEQRYCASNGHPDFWTEPEMSQYGVHYCRHHCDVSSQCLTEQLANPQEGVYAGLLWMAVTSRQDKKRTRMVIPAAEQPRELSCRGCNESAQLERVP